MMVSVLKSLYHVFVFVLEIFHMVNSVTCMNIGTSLEKAIKIVLTKL